MDDYEIEEDNFNVLSDDYITDNQNQMYSPNNFGDVRQSVIPSDVSNLSSCSHKVSKKLLGQFKRNYSFKRERTRE